MVGKHWLVDGAHRLNCDIIATPVPPRLKGSSCEVESLFVGVDREEDVKRFVRSIKNCRLSTVRQSDAGLFAVVECEGTKTLECRASRLRGRVGIFANPRGGELRVTIDSPFTIREKELTKAFQDLRGLRIEGVPHLAKAKIPLTDFIELETDPTELAEKDKLIAKELLGSGFYEVPRPEGLTLDSLRKKVDLSKPALIWRIRRLESLGLKKILGYEELSDDDRKAAYAVFKAALDKK